MAGKFCEHCGAPMEDGARFCNSCGTSASSAPVLPQGAVQQPGSIPQQPLQQSQPGPYAGPAPGYAPPQQPQQSYYPPAAPQNGYADPRLAPMSVGSYIGAFILSAIPIVNIILWFVWAFGSNTNRSKKNFARAILIMTAIGIVLSIVFGSVLAQFIASIYEGIAGSGYSYTYY